MMRWPTTEPVTSAFRPGPIINPTSVRRSGACCHRSEPPVPQEPLALRDQPESRVPPAPRDPLERTDPMAPPQLPAPRVPREPPERMERTARTAPPESPDQQESQVRPGP